MNSIVTYQKSSKLYNRDQRLTKQKPCATKIFLYTTVNVLWKTQYYYIN